MTLQLAIIAGGALVGAVATYKDDAFVGFLIFAAAIYAAQNV